MVNCKQHPPDARLWECGDAEAFGELYARHARAVQAFCLRRTADPGLSEDLTSAVFLEAWRKRARVTITTPTALPYLLGIATNVLRHQWRSQRRHRAAVESMTSRVSPSEHGEDDVIARVDACAQLLRLRELLEDLPRRNREVLALVALGGLSYSETAVALGVPVGTVRSRLARARDRLVADGDAGLISLPLTQGGAA